MRRYRFTPYVTFGIGAFSYDPYAYYQGQKVYLRPLGTEGQGYRGLSGSQILRKYGRLFSTGSGHEIQHQSQNINVGFEIAYRFTTTDYLDDVSKTYVGGDKFPLLPNGNPSLAGLCRIVPMKQGRRLVSKAASVVMPIRMTDT